MTNGRTRLEKFKALAKEVKADPDEKAWDESLEKVAGQKLPPVQQQPEELE